MKFALALFIALGAVLGTPGAGHAQADPASVARALIDAENRHDVEAAVALFTPDAVVIHATGTLTTTAEVRKWQTELAEGNFHANINTPVVAGDKVTFTGDVVLNSFKALGIDKLDATWELTVQQGRVKTFSFVFTPASAARLQAAIAGSASLALTGADPRPLVGVGALFLVLGVALLTLQRRRP
ncbi:MAG TPA: nuclear transport factor 2 family protein [Acidimicrobiales bacterium]|nr:nuclear transport factor 2 family protein [Acidimicrobiales bacterium]